MRGPCSRDSTTGEELGGARQSKRDATERRSFPSERIRELHKKGGHSQKGDQCMRQARKNTRGQRKREVEVKVVLKRGEKKRTLKPGSDENHLYALSGQGDRLGDFDAHAMSGRQKPRTWNYRPRWGGYLKKKKKGKERD